MASGSIESILSALPHEDLLRMAEAGNTAVECMSALHRRRSNLVLVAIEGHGDFVEWNHYPPFDAIDSRSHAQYYFHAHPAEDRDDPDYGHFHTFIRAQGMPPRIVASAVGGEPARGAESGGACHLIAISMSRAGFPERLFTTNRWVTDEIWYRAADAIAALDRFVITSQLPSRQLNQWLTAMIVLFRPQIEQLLITRDRVIEEWQNEHPDQNALEDRRLEITSSTDISIQDQIEALDRALDACTPVKSSIAS
jgi:hypothetical protein